jgi:hypothetical protein
VLTVVVVSSGGPVVGSYAGVMLVCRGHGIPSCL